MDLEGVIDELYGGTRERFVEARNGYVKQARAAGDRVLADAIRVLPKPSVSAWVVNLLARQCVQDLHAVLDLGVRMRDAQERKDGSMLRDLVSDQNDALRRASAAGLAKAADLGQGRTEAVNDRVMQTLRAAMADPAAAAAVASGRLVRDLESPGFGPVDLDGALAGSADVEPYAPASSSIGSVKPVPAVRGGRTRSPRTKAEPDQRAVARAQARLDEASKEADRVGSELAEASTRLASAKTRAAELRTEETGLKEQLASVAAALDEAAGDVRAANKDHAELERADSRSRFAVRRAQAELDALG